MPRSYSSEDRSFIVAWVNGWGHAVQLQATRVAAAGLPFDQGVEADMFLHAANNLRRAVRVFRDDHRVRALLEAFDAESLGLNDARNLLEHFDGYDRGNGSDRKRLRMPDGGLTLFYTDTGSEQLMTVGPVTVNVTRVAQAAGDLVEGMAAIACNRAP